MKIIKTGYYGLDNLDGKDNRSEEWKKQRSELGFDTTELWSLGDTIINFSLPRMKRLFEIEKEINVETEDMKEYYKSYEKVIEGLEIFVRNNGARQFNDEETIKVDYALKEFGNMLPSMWF